MVKFLIIFLLVLIGFGTLAAFSFAIWSVLYSLNTSSKNQDESNRNNDVAGGAGSSNNSNFDSGGIYEGGSDS